MFSIRVETNFLGMDFTVAKDRDKIAKPTANELLNVY